MCWPQHLSRSRRLTPLLRRLDTIAVRSMAGSAFDVEQLRLAAARRLPASCHDDFLRLSRTLLHGPEFQWLLVDAPDEGLRKQVQRSTMCCAQQA